MQTQYNHHTGRPRHNYRLSKSAKLLTHLLAKHYGLELSDTPFSVEKVNSGTRDAGITLANAK